MAEAVKLASESDVVIFIGGLNKADHMDAEGSDRLEYALPYGQNELVEALLEANKNLVVVNISGNAVAMPWADKVSTIVQDWYLGSEAGTSLASVLVGDVNPSGHLPMTWYASLDQNGAHAAGAYPGVKRNDGSGITDLEYAEGIFVGYRYVEKNNLQPLFPFGHGLSYTTFAVDNAKIKTSGSGDNFKATVTVDVTNTGNVDGAEVVQLYISDVECSVARPVKELKGFAKTSLKAGEVKKYIDDNYADEDLSLNLVASHVNFSPNHLSMIFSQQTGETFIKYLTDYRMNKAKEMLKCTGKRSVEISIDVGYKDPHYFSYLFKKTQGMTPTQYRNSK